MKISDIEEENNIMNIPICFTSLTEPKLSKENIMKILSVEDDNIEIQSQIFYISAKDFKGNDVRSDGKCEYQITLKFNVFR